MVVEAGNAWLEHHLFGHFIGLVSRQIDLPGSNGSTLHIRPASLWESWFWSSSEIVFQPKTGPSGTILLTQSWTDRPIILVPTKDNIELLILYQLEDMGFTIVKFRTLEKFTPLPPFPNDRNLREIVRQSPWQAAIGDLDDWRFLYGHLQGMSTEDFNRSTLPQANLGFFRIYHGKETVLKEMEVMSLKQNLN